MKKYLGKYFPLFVLPTLIAFIIAFLIPFVMGVFLSFTEFTTVSNWNFVGLKNYMRIFANDGGFTYSFWFTVLFTAVATIIINLFAFTLSLLLTRGIKGTNIFRTIFFMPNLIGGIVLGYIWRIMINGVLSLFGVDLTFAARYGFWGLIILASWQMIGYMMIIYVAGINSIPQDLIEASSIDGASSWQTLIKIKIPMLMPSITICSFLTITNSFKMYDQNLALTSGEPQRKTAMLAMNIFDTFYGSVNQEGLGQAKAVLFFILVGAIAALQMKLTSEKEVSL